MTKMTRHISFILTAAVTSILCACDLETSDNGDLDGMWHLVRVDTLSTSGVKQMDGEKIYWSFQYKLLQVDDKTGARNSALLRFEHVGGTLRLHTPYVYDRTNGDSPLTDVSLIAPFGINALENNFTVERLNGSNMIINDNYLRLYFKKM